MYFLIYVSETTRAIIGLFHETDEHPHEVLKILGYPKELRLAKVIDNETTNCI